MVTIKWMKMQEYDKNDKNCKKIGKNEIFNKKMAERSSDQLGNFPRCVLWQRCRFDLDFGSKS